MIDISAIEQAAMEANPRRAGDYFDNGLLHCGKCHTRKQSVYNICGRVMVMPHMCKCEAERYKKEKEEKEANERSEEIKRLRVNGINDTAIRGMTFAVDDGRDEKKIDLAKRYVAKWSQLYDENVGLLFYGGTGNGKTFTAACIANALMDKRVPVLMTSFEKIIHHLSGMYGNERIEYLNSINRYDLLIVDDLGAERQSNHALAQVYSVIDGRYKIQKPMIITTNLTLSEMKNPAIVDYQRIYDRVLEMCMTIHFDGESRRKTKAKEKLETARNILLSSD